MKRFIAFFAVFAILFLISNSVASADTVCQPIYGGGQSCITTNNIVVNKTVLNPQTNQFVDNLGVNDPKYQPGFTTSFQISVTNTGNSNASQVDVRDIFPQFVSFGSGAGSFNSNTNTLSFSLNNLAPNETRTVGVVGRIVNSEQISGTPGSVVCVVNQAIASVNGANVSQDNAQLCIQKAAQAVQQVQQAKGFPIFSSVPTVSAPSTGPEALALFAMIPTGLAGWFLRKHSMKKGGSN